MDHTEQIADRIQRAIPQVPSGSLRFWVRGMSRLGERTDENQIDLGWQLLQQIFKAGIADESNVVPLLPAPYTDYLRHDAGKIGIHDASVQRSRRTPGNNIYDSDTEFSHAETAQAIQWVLIRG